jgi:hypothetical protein
LIRNFWWGEDENKRKVHWEAWDVLTRPKNFGGVGFRDLKLLNQAMLARQCWRIISKPDSLCARLLKSIYYPRGNFLDTVFRQDASPSWRGIEYGLKLLKEGLISRIGNGENTNIWRTNWLPRDYNLKPREGKTNSRIRKVNQLILPNSNSWNKNLITQVCYPEDASLILSLKLHVQPCEDFIAWHYERNGKFSVKSAYKLAYNIHNGVRWQAGTSEASDNSRSIWKLIWTMHVPTKVRIFGWRTARDNLATNKNKFRRTLETQGTCMICGMCDETSFHATVSCTKARALRDKMREHWNLPPESRFRESGEDWLLILLGSCSNKQRSQVLLLLWRAWHLRCDIIHNKGQESIGNSVSFLLNYDATLTDCIPVLTNNKGKTAIGMTEPTNHSGFLNHSRLEDMQPTPSIIPTEETVLINVDAAFRPLTGDSAIGAVIRDQSGLIIAASSRTIDRCQDAEEAEAKAKSSSGCSWPLRWASTSLR